MAKKTERELLREELKRMWKLAEIEEPSGSVVKGVDLDDDITGDETDKTSDHKSKTPYEDHVDDQKDITGDETDKTSSHKNKTPFEKDTGGDELEIDITGDETDKTSESPKNITEEEEEDAEDYEEDDDEESDEEDNKDEYIEEEDDP